LDVIEDDEREWAVLPYELIQPDLPLFGIERRHVLEVLTREDKQGIWRAAPGVVQQAALDLVPGHLSINVENAPRLAGCPMGEALVAYDGKRHC
jgi:hypothetical protein